MCLAQVLVNWHVPLAAVLTGQKLALETEALGVTLELKLVVLWLEAQDLALELVKWLLVLLLDPLALGELAPHVHRRRVGRLRVQFLVERGERASSLVQVHVGLRCSVLIIAHQVDGVLEVALGLVVRRDVLALVVGRIGGRGALGVRTALVEGSSDNSSHFVFGLKVCSPLLLDSIDVAGALELLD